MRSGPLLSLIALLVIPSGCTPITDNTQAQPSAENGAAQGSTPAPGAPGASSGSTAADPSTSSSNSTPDPAPAAGQGAATALFIAETKTPTPVIDVLNPGRLQVVEGCLTVTLDGRERATAVFPPGVKPELRENKLVAVSFEGRRIPVDQQTAIPGGVIDSSSVALVKPIPPSCPKTLFGLGG